MGSIFLNLFLKVFKNPLKKGKILQSGKGVNQIFISTLDFHHFPEEIEFFPVPEEIFLK